MRLRPGKAMNAGFHQNENASDGECTVILWPLRKKGAASYVTPSMVNQTSEMFKYEKNVS